MVQTNLVYTINIYSGTNNKYLIHVTTGLRDPMADEKIDHPEAYFDNDEYEAILCDKKITTNLVSYQTFLQ